MNAPPPLGPESRRRLLQVHDRIREFWERVRAHLESHMACGPGCDGCCRQVLRLRGVEAAYVLEGVQGLGAPALSVVWRAVEAGGDDACPLLHGGECLVHAHRPAICRTHGLLLVRRQGGGAVLHHCPRNFAGLDPVDLPPALFLDEGRLAMLLDLVDALYARETGWPGHRVRLDEVLKAGLCT